MGRSEGGGGEFNPNPNPNPYPNPEVNPNPNPNQAAEEKLRAAMPWPWQTADPEKLRPAFERAKTLGAKADLLGEAEAKLKAAERGRSSSCSNGSCNDLRSFDSGAPAASSALAGGAANGGAAPDDNWRVIEPKPRRRSPITDPNPNPTTEEHRSPPMSPTSPKSPTVASKQGSNSPPQQAAEERLVREAMPWGRMADPVKLRPAIAEAKVSSK